MALLGVLQLFVGHLELAARSILGDGFGEKLPKRSWSGHMTVNIDDFVTVVHKTSFKFLVPSFKFLVDPETRNQKLET
jgi:hypothetical protein